MLDELGGCRLDVKSATVAGIARRPKSTSQEEAGGKQELLFVFEDLTILSLATDRRTLHPVFRLPFGG